MLSFNVELGREVADRDLGTRGQGSEKEIE